MKGVNNNILHISVCKWWGTVTSEPHYSKCVRGLSVSTLLGRETRLCSRPTESESHFNKILQVVCSRFTDEKNYPGTHEKKLHHGRRNFVKCANMSEKIRTKK